ncbi:Zn-dependent alcohol dehydrogenases class III (plasmid) [Rubrobacter radiotolerans]|uniref:NAD(P)-dependent alcohol dehydrogenase n=1 Tax=Rubrobacter radiotolerans TaxID=42256 RepID=A0A023X739_RUBRA|nr:NAD(P)-dependent alcohol dehydrogenase [Rubrobacter radiotolerans]AHY48262.1 Zn-dependent alcohol dehydrogenases class III [Rubrobacter radiotolerans]MDX5895535.1 NAD(P)-dependent alcohol dehydrogenase [Rubrobacter radiotolerans]SMC01459.1 aryl-alcohol dehydrogenase [Rubrobacter radiotolerans DSM 5868]
MDAKAAVVREKEQDFVIEDVRIGEPRADEVLVRVVACGVCHTDLICRDQWYPVPLPSVFGHEGSGIVEAVGESVTKVAPGDRVAMSYNSCGGCNNCLSGNPGYCLKFFEANFTGARIDGTNAYEGAGDGSSGDEVHGHFFSQSSFATYALARERNVVKVRDDVPLELVGPLGCGIQTGAGGVLNSLRPEAGSSIAVFGTGTVGMAAIMAARVAGCTTIIGVDIKPNRLELARELGATHVINGAEEKTVERIKEITSGGANYSIETTASPEVFRQSVDCLTQLGTCGLIGAAAVGTEAKVDISTMLLFGHRIQGIIEGDAIPDVFIPKLLELYVQGRFPFDKLVKFYELEEINQAAHDSESGEVLKAILKMPV